MSVFNTLIGEMEYDGLITGQNPAPRMDGGIIAAVAEETTYKRGTLLQKASGKLAIYTSGTPDCILTDDTVVGTADVHVVVYAAGCFDETKVAEATGVDSISTAAKDTLRTKGIVFKSAMTM